MKKIFQKIHLWLSIPFGLIITLICFSGAMLVFEDEITQLIDRELYYVDNIGTKHLPVDSLIQTASKQLPEEIRITGITFFPEAKRTCLISTSKSKRSALAIDPYTGEVKGMQERLPFFGTMFSLHRWLLDSRPNGDGIFWGKIAVGTSTLLFVLILISGIVIWWPRTIRGLKNRLCIKTSAGRRRFWYDLHVAGGMYALIVLLALALTGLTWSFSWYRSGFYRLFGADSRQSAVQGSEKDMQGKRQKPEKPTADYSQAQKVLERLRTEYADYHQITVTTNSASVSLNHWGNQKATDRYTYDPRNGQIIQTNKYADATRSGKLRGWIYTVHVGSWGGLTTRLITFLVALFGASLPLTGYYLWIKRTFRKKHSDEKTIGREI